MSCPPGTMKQAVDHDNARCQPCLETQYIIDPNNHACEKCALGLKCRGNALVEPVVANSTWEADGGVYKLRYANFLSI